MGVIQARWRRDPLGFLADSARRASTGVFHLPWGAWCVGDTELALAVLRDPLFNAGMAPFFGDLLPSRSAQIALGRAVRSTVRAYLPEYRERLAEAVADLPAVSRWPAAGPRLVYAGIADLLLHPQSAPAVRQVQRQFVDANLIGASPSIRQRARAEVWRPRLRAAITEHVRERREERTLGGEPRDLLDVVIAACPAEAADRTVTSLYGLLRRSIVGTVSDAVAWSLLLGCMHCPPGSSWPWPVDRVVREAARHRPVVWMVGRRTPHPLEYGGIPFQAGTVLSVSPYLLHHDARRWDRPETFRPQRWAEAGACGPYLPFSAGPFTCAGAAVAHTLITETVTGLTRHARLTIRGGDTRPVVTDRNLPRPFTLHRTPSPRPTPLQKGGEPWPP
ncbi:cytochrome P450 [Kitasatospora sp. NPDC001660]